MLHLRQRDPIHKALRYDRPVPPSHQVILDQLIEIYEKAIKPMEDAYHYNDLPERTDMSGEMN